MAASHQIELLAIAFALSSVIGLEREWRQKHAGLRTHTLVGVGAAAFAIVGLARFGDSRIAAQVVTGIGFLGAGVIFVRRHDVRGLTTAAGVWACASVGLAVGSELVALGVAITVADLIVSLVYTPIVHRMPSSRIVERDIELTYRDGEGILRQVIADTTARRFAVSDLDVQRRDHDRSLVEVSFRVEGKGDGEGLAEALGRIDGVTSVKLPADG
jgi:putative Mg2+ transporter-C (MgtC) family protein